MRRAAAAIAEARSSRRAAVGGLCVDHLDGEVGRAPRDGERRRQPGRAAAGDQDIWLASAVIESSLA